MTDNRWIYQREYIHVGLPAARSLAAVHADDKFEQDFVILLFLELAASARVLVLVAALPADDRLIELPDSPPFSAATVPNTTIRAYRLFVFLLRPHAIAAARSTVFSFVTLQCSQCS